MRKQLFFLRGSYSGESSRGLIRNGDDWVYPSGMAAFCPLCAEVWHIALVEGEATMVHHIPCDRHKPGDRLGRWSTGSVSRLCVPGSLWCEWDSDWNNALPKALLQRELLLMLDFHERYDNERDSDNTTQDIRAEDTP